MRDLLDLPEIPEKFPHRLVYLDVPARMSEGVIVMAPSKWRKDS